VLQYAPNFIAIFSKPNGGVLACDGISFIKTRKQYPNCHSEHDLDPVLQNQLTGAFYAASGEFTEKPSISLA